MKKTVLVVEDEPAILGFVQETLAKAGFAVVASNGGRGVWDQILKVKPSLLVLDVMLPALDGYTLTLRLSRDPSTQEIPVVVMTAEAGARSLFEKIPQVAGFLKKPFKAEDLLAAAKRATSS